MPTDMTQPNLVKPVHSVQTALVMCLGPCQLRQRALRKLERFSLSLTIHVQYTSLFTSLTITTRKLFKACSLSSPVRLVWMFLLRTFQRIYTNWNDTSSILILGMNEKASSVGKCNLYVLRYIVVHIGVQYIFLEKSIYFSTSPVT